MRDSNPPDLAKAPDSANKRRISLLRRNSSSHSDSDSEPITGDDVTSDKNTSPGGNKVTCTSAEYVQPIEMIEVKKEEQVTPEKGDKICEVNTDKGRPQIGLVDPVSGEVNITHLDSKVDILGQEHDHEKGGT